MTLLKKQFVVSWEAGEGEKTTQCFPRCRAVLLLGVPRQWKTNRESVCTLYPVRGGEVCPPAPPEMELDTSWRQRNAFWSVVVQ